jgi:hemolysin activation/secretion protein
LESEVLGDKGYVANIEFHTPSIGQRLSSKFRDLHAIAFIDYGEVVTINPLASQRASASLSSSGLGIIANFYGLNAMLHYAKVFKDGAIGRTVSGDERLHIGLEYPF